MAVATSSPSVDAAAASLLDAAGYPTPPTVEDTVRMLLNEIDSARAAIDDADDRIGILEQDLDKQTAAAFANQEIADDCYQDGHRTGYQHGYFAGRQAAAREPCTYPADGATS